MRLLISVFLLVLLTAGAHAQFSMDQKKKDTPKPVDNAQQRKDDEKAFERAQRLVPNASAPHDPWGTVRSKKQ